MRPRTDVEGLAGARSEVLFRLAYAFGALVVLAAFLHQPGIEHYGPSELGRMVDGTASKPFVYRVLVPWTIRGAIELIPADIQHWLVDAGGRGRLAAALAFCDHVPARQCTAFLVATVIMYGALLGFCFALRQLLSTVFVAPRTFVSAVPLFGLALLPPFFCYTSFVYDFPALLLFTLGLSLMVRERWSAYLLVFVSACFNKETTVLLLVVFAVHFRERLARRSLLGVLAAQAVAFAVIKAGLAWTFHGNADVAVDHLGHNLNLLRACPPSTAVSWLTLVLLVVARWPDKPRFLKDSLWILVPLLGLTLFLGFLDELRDFYEAFPPVILLIAHSVAGLAGIDVQRATPERKALAERPQPPPLSPASERPRRPKRPPQALASRAL